MCALDVSRLFDELFLYFLTPQQLSLALTLHVPNSHTCTFIAFRNVSCEGDKHNIFDQMSHLIVENGARC